MKATEPLSTILISIDQGGHGEKKDSSGLRSILVPSCITQYVSYVMKISWLKESLLVSSEILHNITTS